MEEYWAGVEINMKPTKRKNPNVKHYRLFCAKRKGLITGNLKFTSKAQRMGA
jgi:hypothetical protein